LKKASQRIGSSEAGLLGSAPGPSVLAWNASSACAAAESPRASHVAAWSSTCPDGSRIDTSGTPIPPLGSRPASGT
jgi:hypothetical protein